MSSTFGNGNVIIVPDDSLFDVEMERAGRRLVVVDFTASWCGPCQRIAPVFVNLSVKYMDAMFLKVDVDQCQNTAESRGVRAMPTFHFYQNKTKLDEIRGADPVALENKIRQLISAQPTNNDIVVDPKRVANGRTWSCFDQLSVNQPKVFLDVSEILLKFANNIIDNPKNPKYRSIRIGNKIFQNRLLPVEGGVECLFAMGFEERDDHLIFPTEISLDALRILRDTIHDERTRMSTHDNEPSPRSVSVPINHLHQQQPQQTKQPDVQLSSTGQNVPAKMTPPQWQFYAKLKSSSDHVMLYEDPDLQRRARSHIPVAELERKAQEMSETSKKGGGRGVSASDCLVLVLLEWFKKFFEWMDKPKCCGVEALHQGNVPTTSEEEKWKAGQVENYVCPKCKKHIRFPRYNHPAKLLETRCGRCGEWANCFTLFCRSLGYETRHVLDWTDHVWTEIFSESQQRWIHCDSCEGTCDKPLMYEAGWGKKLTYVIAFSREEVFDVTWRYSANHEQVRQRRNEVSEQWLTNITMQLTQQLQKGLPSERRQLLDARTMQELVEFMKLRSVTPGELQGRSSGSHAWRQIRGELGTTTDTKKYVPYIFKLSAEEIKAKRMRIRYSAAVNTYYRCADDQLQTGSCAALSDWKAGTNAVESIFRKVENDWKMAYLAREGRSSTGVITWKVDVTDSGHVIDTVTLVVSSCTFENGQVEWIVNGDDTEMQHIALDGGTEPQTLNCLRGSKTFTLTARLSGGKGDVAWQHAQLFRQSINSRDEFPLDIDIQLK